MSTSVAAQLNEGLRDILVDFYLEFVVPNSETLLDLQLSNKLKTANDLYEFLLLDVQVTQAVETSPVASAISSLQQYINGILMSMEPGYENADIPSSYVTDWRDQQSQYPIWAANQMIAWYPEMYIDPSLRMKKTSYFEQLENDINQNRIEFDTTQEAVKNYLANFEEVANLTLINGYVDSHLFAEGTYYFIGKSNTEKTFYWRSVNMSERAYKSVGSSEGPKVDHPSPGAWSDWKNMVLPITECTIERTIRPVFFNNRLMIGWVDYLTNESDFEGLDTLASRSERNSDNTTLDFNTVKSKPLFRVNLIYKKYDDQWSAPICYMSTTALVDKDEIELVLTWDTSSSTSDLFIALYSGYQDAADTSGINDTYRFLKTVRVDQNFNIMPGFPVQEKVPTGVTRPSPNEYETLKIVRIFSRLNRGRMQFKIPSINTVIKTVTTHNPPTGIWRYENFHDLVLDREKNTDVTYNQESAKLIFQSTISDNVSHWEGASITIPLTNLNVSHSAQQSDVTFNYVFGRGTHLGWHTVVQGSYVQTSGDIFKNGATLDDIARNYSYFRLRCMGTSEFYMFADLKLYNSDFLGKGIPAPDTSGRAEVGGFLPSTTYLALVNSTSADDYGSKFYFPGQQSTASRWYPPEEHPRIGFVPAGEFRISTYIAYPRNPLAPTDGQLTVITTGTPAELLTAPARLDTVIAINKENRLPIWAVDWPSDHRIFNIVHGLRLERRINNGWQVVGHALKRTEIELETTTDQTEAQLTAPRLSHLVSTDGTAEFIDFTGSAIAKSDGSTSLSRTPVRMNTLFARELINRANVSLENLLSWETQWLPEPLMLAGQPGTAMDFNGANGVYFWELFLHLPFMVAHRLLLEQQFDSAETWLAFIFDPSRKSNPSGRPDYWNVRPLVADASQSDADHATRAPLDPDGIAASHPVRYQKAVYDFYIKILIARGDMAYRQLTPDSLGEAKLWYVRCLDLLGPRPDQKLVNRWTPLSLQTLADSTNTRLRGLEMQMAEQRQELASNLAENAGEATIRFDQHSLSLRPFAQDPTLPELDSDYLRPPLNANLVAHWNTLESRLYNLRHNFTLDGKPLSLALFAAPLNPRDLLAAFGQGASSGAAGRLLAQEAPHYRFNVLHSRALNAVETLMQFGNTLLSLIERREQAELLELEHQQAWSFAQFAIDLQSQAQNVEAEARLALLATQQVIGNRISHFSKLADEVVSAGEVAAGALHLAGRVSEVVAGVAAVLAGGLMVPPNTAGAGAVTITGTATGGGGSAMGGGQRLDGIPQAVRDGAFAVASTLHGSGEAIDRVEQYRRRHQEWQLARDQAVLESAQVDAQLKVHDEQILMTQLQLQQAQAALDNAKVTHELLAKRFTRSQLYQWLSGQYSTFYYQMYDAAVSLCLTAEAAWQYELADFSTRFIPTNSWNDSYRGLTAGEPLKLNLLKMEAAYLARNERLLEVNRTVSVRQLLTQRSNDGSLDETDWLRFLEGLMDGDAAASEIVLGQAVFDANHPGQYLRRIKRIGVSLPVLVGPYQDVNATLSQTRNALAMAPSVEAVVALRDGVSASAGQVKENLRASQQIALSKGVDDDGLFFFRFDDERYLPFEGTGAVSRWNLEFPLPAQGADSWEAERRAELLASLTDVILHVQYTARFGGTQFADQVRASYAEDARKHKTPRKSKA